MALRRTRREVYRVYGEEAYLAGLDAPSEWHAELPQGTRERRLRRLAGAAAVTGVVGAVGGTILLVHNGSRSSDAKLAGVGTPRARAALPRADRSAQAVKAGRASPAGRGRLHRDGVAQRRSAGDWPVLRRRPPSAGWAHLRAAREVAPIAPTLPVSATGEHPERPVPAVAEISPAQSEFGFER